MEHFIVERHTRLSRIGQVAGLIGVCAIVAMPWWSGRQGQHLMAQILYTIALAQMWNLLAGYGGIISIGQQIYVGLGAYCLVVLGLGAGINPFLVIPIAGIVCAVLAIPLAALLFRLKGAHLAVGTWVVSEVFRLLVSNTEALGGGSGLSVAATMRGMPTWWRESVTLWVAAILGIGACAMVYAVLRSRYGLALTAVRDNEVAARSLGVPTGKIKWVVYIGSAAGCGMLGALIFVTKLRVSPDAAFSIDWSTLMLFTVVIGGIGTIEGPIVGALVYFVLRQSLGDLGVWYQIVMGVLAIVFMIWCSKGIWGRCASGRNMSIFPTRTRIVVDPVRSQVAGPEAKMNSMEAP
ncbi:branched-chain amino acid ABC transporter permease [Burkholderia sp. Ac-20353]|uniref:ABC transporter permease subunit n=1 Tax=Burkholderia sp. Ac-20353 TaxID=2703894 RepID=UPI00197B0EB9|nr:branched-chain amino acid ABC transporter permease [Burkholderia sp. Ac-20353]